MTNEANWLRTLREHVERKTLQQVGDILGYSKAALSRVLTNKYPHDTKRLAQRVAEKLQPLNPAPKRAPLPPQLWKLDRKAHKRLKIIVRGAGEKAGAELFGIPPERVWPLLEGRDPLGAADVIAKFSERPFTEERK